MTPHSEVCLITRMQKQPVLVGRQIWVEAPPGPSRRIQLQLVLEEIQRYGVSMPGRRCGALDVGLYTYKYK